MDAPVRYVRSRDGTRIAYSVVGDGPPLVHLQVPSLSHIELYPRLPGARDYLERLGRGRKLIRVDFRGTGMSEREFEDHSPEALTDDVEAVVDALGLNDFELTAGGARVTPALGLTTRRPASVKRLLLSFPFTARPARADQPVDSGQRGMRALMESNWDLWLEITTQRNTGRPISEIQEAIAFVRRCVDQHNQVAEAKAARPELDWERAVAVDIPVLVLEFENNVRIPSGRMQEFAKRFPHGRYMSLPESAMPPPYGETEPYLQAVMEFLGPPPLAAPPVATVDESHLSPREREVLSLLAAGRTEPEIATALFISRSTVSRHVVSVYTKIGAHRKAEAVAWAIRHGLG